MKKKKKYVQPEIKQNNIKLNLFFFQIAPSNLLANCCQWNGVCNPYWCAGETCVPDGAGGHCE